MGVVIPIGLSNYDIILVIILLVVLVLYKKGIICQPKNDSKVTALEMDSVQIQQKTNGQFNWTLNISLICIISIILKSYLVFLIW